MDGPRKDIMEKLKGQTRLPRLAAPKRCDLTLKPDLVTCTFSGSVCIDIDILEATSVLVLNALDLSIQEARYSSSTGLKYQPSDVVVDGEDEILVLVFDDVLGAGDGVLVIKFSGVLDDSMMGFYRGTYMDGGVKKNMATTQFEAVDARRCFPCWDEPALKSYFKVTLIVPSELVALSNMPVIKEEIQENFKTVHFEEYPLMSTYLVAFVVGSFDYIEDKTSDGTEVRVYSPVGRSDEGRFALTLAVRSLDFFGKFFSMPYPLPKLDMVGVPDFSTGAMENYGLIIYRDVLLLQNDKDCTAANKQTLAIVVAHEVAHQWFGNFVTMEWWTHLWLNEGFATWISYLAVENFFPEWKIWTQFCEVTTGGLLLDSLEESHPSEVEVGHAHSVKLFDDIAYKKGSSVIRMLQDYLGDEIFQRGLSSYIKKYACKNAKTNDLWEVLSEEAGSEVNRMMDTWTKKKGYPVVSVKLQGHNLEFEQSQFLSSGLQASGEWMIPISFSVGSYTRQRKFLLERKCSSEDISDRLNFTCRNLSSNQINIQDESDGELWVKVNIDQTGFYRVKYEDKLCSRLRRAIQNNSLSGIDKFGILDDACALCEACEVPLSSLLSLMAVYKEEQDHTVLSRLIDACENIIKISGDAVPHMVDQLKQFIINLLLNPAENLGWDPKPEETHSDALLREQVLVALVSLDHDRT